MAALPGVRRGGAVRLLPAGRPLYPAGAGIARQLPAALRRAEDERHHRRTVQFRHPGHRADRGGDLRLQAGAAVSAAPPGDRRDHSGWPPAGRDRRQSAPLPPPHPGPTVARAEGRRTAPPGGADAMSSAAWAAIEPAKVLPDDLYAGTLVGRAWLPAADGRVAGPAVVAIRAAGIFDLGAAAPTMSELCAAPDPVALMRQTAGRRIG